MAAPFVEHLAGVVATPGNLGEKEPVIAVVRAIQRTVLPKTWDVAGGTGSIVAVLLPSKIWYLVICNDDGAAKGQIDTLLTALGRT